MACIKTTLSRSWKPWWVWLRAVFVSGWGRGTMRLRSVNDAPEGQRGRWADDTPGEEVGWCTPRRNTAHRERRVRAARRRQLRCGRGGGRKFSGLNRVERRHRRWAIFITEIMLMSAFETETAILGASSRRPAGGILPFLAFWRVKIVSLQACGARFFTRSYSSPAFFVTRMQQFGLPTERKGLAVLAHHHKNRNAVIVRVTALVESPPRGVRSTFELGGT